MEIAIKERIRIARAAILAQVDFLHENLGRVESQWKEDATRVTQVDLEVAERIFGDLGEAFASDDFFSEEMDPGQGVLRAEAEFSWILDPVDGTNNYALGIPFCSIALALLRDGRPVYGFVYDASRRRLMEGGKGFPLLDGETKIEAGAKAGTNFVAIHSARNVEERDLLQPVVSNFKVRAMGSSALHLAYVANGLFAGMVDVNVKVWDIAAAFALCEAAGVEVRFLKGEAFPLREFDVKMRALHVCAGRAEVCGRLAELLASKRG